MPCNSARSILNTISFSAVKARDFFYIEVNLFSPFCYRSRTFKAETIPEERHKRLSDYSLKTVVCLALYKRVYLT